jgi:hypothetical protein
MCFNFLPIWIKFGTGYAHKISLIGDCEFRASRFSESHILLKGSNKFLSALPVFYELGEVRYERSERKSTEHISFVKITSVMVIHFLRHVMESRLRLRVKQIIFRGERTPW